MAYIATVEDSRIDVTNIRDILIQGSSAHPVIQFVLDPALDGYTWTIRGTYLGSGIAVTSGALSKTESAQSILVNWTVSADFTTYYGEMQLALVGANGTGTEIVKSLGSVNIQRDWSIGSLPAITLNLFEQLFAQTESAISTHNSDASAHSTQIAAAISAHNTSALSHSRLIQNKNWLYDGRDLSTIFTAEQFIAAVRADDWSNIRVGDYWPITLTGTYRDYGSYTCPSGTNYYSDTGLTTLVGSTSTSYEATYVNATYCSIVISATTYYVSTAACRDYYTRTLSSSVFKLEIGANSPYINYGDLAFSSPHIVLISRDCIPSLLKMRKSDSAWTDASATNPWLGSALYKTLNDPTYGLLSLVAATDIGSYIYSGPNAKGMRWLGETKAAGATTPTSYSWLDRGKLFLPTETEISGLSTLTSNYFSLSLSRILNIFFGSTRHAIKGLGNGGSRTTWWNSSSQVGSATTFVTTYYSGDENPRASSTPYGVPLCFIIA